MRRPQRYELFNQKNTNTLIVKRFLTIVERVCYQPALKGDFETKVKDLRERYNIPL